MERNANRTANPHICMIRVPLNQQKQGPSWPPFLRMEHKTQMLGVARPARNQENLTRPDGGSRESMTATAVLHASEGCVGLRSITHTHMGQVCPPATLFDGAPLQHTQLAVTCLAVRLLTSCGGPAPTHTAPSEAVSIELLRSMALQAHEGTRLNGVCLHPGIGFPLAQNATEDSWRLEALSNSGKRLRVGSFVVRIRVVLAEYIFVLAEKLALPQRRVTVEPRASQQDVLNFGWSWAPPAF